MDRDPSPSRYQGNLSKYYPKHMIATESRKLGKIFRQKSTESKDTPELFSKSMQNACKKSTDPYQLKVLYLQLCWHKSFYGSVFFKGQTKKPFKPVHLLVYTDKQVTVAINADCLHLFSVSPQPVSHTPTHRTQASLTLGTQLTHTCITIHSHFTPPHSICPHTGSTHLYRRHFYT